MSTVARMVDRPESVMSPATFIGEHPRIQELLALADRIASASTPVILVGETGSGKELIAQRIHRRSGRPGALVPVNAAALPEGIAESELFGASQGAFSGATRDRAGLFEAAHRGTLFLDEASDLSMATQARLLRIIEDGALRRVGESRDRRVDTRLIIAVQSAPIDLIRAGRWRTDFFFRVASIQLLIPPLRDRPSDVPLLVNHFLARLGHEPVSHGLERLREHQWPGNVRQVRAMVERARLIAGDAIVTADALLDALRSIDLQQSPPERPRGAGREALRDLERAYIERLLTTSHGSVHDAAATLGLSQSQLYRRLRALGIVPPRFRP